MLPSLLVIEDVAKDAREACQVAQNVGFETVELKLNSTEAKKALEASLASGTLPSAILLDIDLNGESGFDVMRFWHSTPQLRAIPLVVWTVLEGNYPEICRLFGVNHVVSKSKTVPQLEQTLRDVLSFLHGQAARI